MKGSALASSPLLAVMVWDVALLVNLGDYGSGTVFLMALGLLLMSTISTIGVVVTGGRWAHRLGLVVIGSTYLVALIREIDVLWFVGILASTAAAFLMLSPAVLSGVRKLPAAAGPSSQAVMTPLILLGAPFLLGISSYDSSSNLALLTVGIGAPVIAFAYTRVLPGGLWGIRIVWPTLAILAWSLIGLPVGLTSVILGAVVAVLAWHPSVSAAFHPPREVGSTLSIPPELAPQEILDAANLDERGRPRS